MSNHTKILNLTSDSIIIQTLLCFFYNVFLTFIVKCLINGFLKCFKNILLQMVSYPSFLTIAKRFLSNVWKTHKCLLGTLYRTFRKRLTYTPYLKLLLTLRLGQLFWYLEDIFLIRIFSIDIHHVHIIRQ